ncbi:ATP-binding Cassette (ABC) Superfamily [Thraustotheca clavata]|uniref:ATP-binding Cassette (ABC) Superfamily n=1 Tax=Thraustotheca clavata TaxID=74557 RepID=A0A1W0A084_9STRA|nr:ATP-binding Cassette (ABC) Superfamily [Thraustotheca clavata]
MPRAAAPRKPSSMADDATPIGPDFTPMEDTLPSSAKQKLPQQKSRLGCLRLIDSRQWHYIYMILLCMDFFGNLVAVSFTSTRNFIDYALKTRLGSSACMAVYVFDMLLRLLAMRGAFFRSAANIGDLLTIFLLGGSLASRFVLADNVNKLKVYEDGWTTTYHTNHKYRSNQIELYLDAIYVVLAACHIILKPRARTFSKKLHNYANHDHIRISMESLRMSLRRIPGVTAVAVEMMETDLLIICGRSHGEMTREELMRFLERALLYRPKNIRANEFLMFLRDIDATSIQNAYGAWDVVKSTFGHWSTQKWDLFCTTVVVFVAASITPLLSFFLQIVTDKGFPSSVYTYALNEFNDMGYQTGLSIHSEYKWKNQTTNDNGTLVDLPFSPPQQLAIGVIGIMAISIPFTIADYAIGYFQSKMIAKATQNIQNSLLDVIMHQDTGFFSERTDGDLNNLFQSDIARVNAMWQAVFWNLMNPIVAIVIGFAYLLYQEPVVGLMSFAFSAVVVTSGPQGLAGKQSQVFGSKNAYVAAEFQNAVACQKVVRSYGIQEPLLKRFGGTITTLRKAQFSKDFWSSVVQIYIESAMFIFVQVMTACLVMKVFRGDITSGDFFSCVTLLGRISSPVTVLGGFMRVAIGNASSLQRLDEIVYGAADDFVKLEKEDLRLPAIPRMKSKLTVQNVSFKYDDKSENWTLDNINAKFKKGDYACIVGPSGCGKSTLLGCLMQFYDVSQGAICIDDLDSKGYSKASYSNQMSVVFQDGGILNGSILENIMYGNSNATREQCLEAAKLAECHDFVKTLKDSYDTIIGQHAVVNLSGGQSQRICLARALVRHPSIMLLDEATSALDQETEASIVETLENISKKMQMTIISVTHRLSTTRNADKILVMEAGKIIDSGTYNQLMAKPQSLFADMVRKMEEGNEPERVDAPNRNSFSFNNHFAGDMGNVLDTHRALEEFNQSLAQRSVEERSFHRRHGANLSQLSNRSGNNNSAMRNRGKNGTLEPQPSSTSARQGRDSYVVL